MELAEKDQLLQHFHLLVETALLGQIAYAFEAGAIEWLFEEPDRPGIGHGDAHHHANRACLSRSIRAQQPKHLARIDGKAKIAHGDLALVGLCNSCEFND